jgi:hypothetical protein
MSDRVTIQMHIQSARIVDERNLVLIGGREIVTNDYGTGGLGDRDLYAGWDWCAPHDAGDRYAFLSPEFEDERRDGKVDWEIASQMMAIRRNGSWDRLAEPNECVDALLTRAGARPVAFIVDAKGAWQTWPFDDSPEGLASGSPALEGSLQCVASLGARIFAATLHARDEQPGWRCGVATLAGDRWTELASFRVKNFWDAPAYMAALSEHDIMLGGSRGYFHFDGKEIAYHSLDFAGLIRCLVRIDDRIVFGTNAGDVFAYRDRTFERVAAVGAGVTGIAHFAGALHLATSEGVLRASAVPNFETLWPVPTNDITTADGQLWLIEPHRIVRSHDGQSFHPLALRRAI